MITFLWKEAKSNLLGSIYKDSEVIILDEPTNELDKKGVEYYKNVLQKIKKIRLLF